MKKYIKLFINYIYSYNEFQMSFKDYIIIMNNYFDYLEIK